MREQDKRIEIMENATPIKAIFTMSIPVILGMMVNVVYNLVDTWFIGRLGDELQLAASNFCTPIFVIIMAVASLIGTGGASYLSRSMGSNEEDKAQNTLSTGIVLIIIFSILMALLGIVFQNQIPYLLGASDLSYQYTKDYAITLMVGSICIISNFALGQLIRAEGSTSLSMVGMMIGTVANIILDPIFIFTFGWEIKGAAIATVIGNGLSAIYFLICYVRQKTLLKLTFATFRIDPVIWKQIFAIGVPATLGQMLISISQMVCNNLASAYGDITVASLGIALKIMTIGTYVFMGFSAGCQPLMGYNYGAGNYKRVTQFIKNGIIATSLVGLGLTILLGCLAPILVATFTPIEEVRNSGTIILRSLIFSLPFMGGTSLCSTTFQSMGKPLKAFFITVSRQGILYIPLLIGLNKVFGLKGMVFSQPITDFIMLIIASAFIFKVLKGLELEIYEETEMVLE